MTSPPRSSATVSRRLLWMLLAFVLVSVPTWLLYDHFARERYFLPFNLVHHDDAIEQIQRHPRFCNSIGSAGQTALVHSAMRGWPDALKLLLSQGADPNKRDGYGELAIFEGAVYTTPAGAEIVRMLLDAGADWHLRDANDADLMCTACGRPNVEVIQLLLDRGWDASRPSEGVPGNSTPLFCALHSTNGNTESRMKALKLLLDAGADIHAKILDKTVLEDIAEAEQGTTEAPRNLVQELQTEIAYLKAVAAK